MNSESIDKAWADDAERQLALSVRALGNNQPALQVSEPECFTSVCVLMATGGHSTEQANADWQRLIYTVADEPWFRAGFVDLSTTLRADPGGTLYVTYLLRRGYSW
ncbi:hypothetical protein LF41_1338 [Lysobacter dokdonensis DS-58]|uniref:Uncharacterized protein n=1 Tax=Lysobacter dokdonensis DS-58 TaxID=1300345 RepID=A0A0A2WZB3_9GAMM|nr:hypothetical protein LF41_1338 [Lysobacter dokdonensis DS-58]